MGKAVQLIGVYIAVGPSLALAADPTPLFARDVQPLLKRHCLKCHGPAKREAKLNLSTPGGIVRGGMNGAVLVPHDAQASLLFKRVAEDEMPPDEPLSEADKQLLHRWIASGAPGLPSRESVAGVADGKDHWAFQPLKKPELPAVHDATRLRSPIDRFIQAALEVEQLTIGPEADRSTLIRRVSFDLTGLPPQRAEIAAFLHDDAPDAYARMVDRYLASPHYGERWGKYWLDAAGYADSNGYFNADSDRPLAWRYRDWVVRALNRDMPFDQFVREQLAGDELAQFSGNDATPETIELLEATHYLRNGQDGSGESDGNPDEVRADRYYAIESTIQNVTNSLFGLTIQCAKCHDHKFEPILQRDYYQMQAVLTPAFNLQQWVVPNQRFIYASLPGEFAKWEAQVKSLDAELAALKTHLAQWVRQNRPRGETLFADDFDHAAVPLADRWSNTAPGDNAPAGAMPVQIDSLQAPGLAARDGALRIVTAGDQGEGWVSTREKFDWTPEDVGGAIQVTFDLVADRLEQLGNKPALRIGYYVALHDFNKDSGLAGGNVLIDGNPDTATTVYRDYPGTNSKPIGEIGAVPYKPGRNYGVRITHIEKQKYKLEHLVDFLPEGKSLTLSAADLPDGGFGFEYYATRSFIVDNLMIERLSTSAEAVAARDRFQKELTAQRQSLDESQKKRAAIAERPGKIAWVGDVSETAPDVFLLERGDYAKPSIKVEPAGLTVLTDPLHPLEIRPLTAPAKSTGRRLAFANWVTEPKSSSSALLARVQVNRIWQRHFGTGIVATPDNLGVSGAPPSHPELLEWLAHELFHGLVNAPNKPTLGKGGSLKHLHRLILNSATYRQTGRDHEQSRQRDPDNRLYSRFPVRRLDAEAIRDALLAVSGDLDPGLAGPFAATKRTDAGEVVAADAAGAGRRRSIYLQQRRTQVVSFLAVFDAPTIVFNSVQRPVSTMPLQALALFNSEFVLERAKNFATRLERSHTDESARLRAAYEMTWGREPDDLELKIAAEFLETQAAEYQTQSDARQRAWIDFCQMLFASNEFLYIE